MKKHMWLHSCSYKSDRCFGWPYVYNKWRTWFCTCRMSWIVLWQYKIIGRTYLSRIRQQELLGSGRILGIRKFFFYDQIDLGYSRNINIALVEQMWIIERFQHTIKHGKGANGYELMVVMLSSTDSYRRIGIF